MEFQRGHTLVVTTFFVSFGCFVGGGAGDELMAKGGFVAKVLHVFGGVCLIGV